VAVVLSMLLTGCGPHRPAVYIVKRGDTVYSIALHHGVDYHDLARWNHLPPDNLITPGQRLFLAQPRAGTAVPAAPQVHAQSPPPVPPGPPIAWAWPAEGHITSGVVKPNGGVGLDILGDAGELIRAAADGRVVYTGSGLRAYGELIIIKHDERYLSAYGHNASVLVQEGQEVRAGMPIATMGPGTTGRPTLYFEIRLLGRPVDPLTLLPARP
jgi:lipoprotein NlpD